MTQSDDPYGIQQLAALTTKAVAMGGPAEIEKQHAKGRMTVRERIEHLLDPNSFDEQGLLVHSELPEAKDKTPCDGKVCGYGTINGRMVFVAGEDVTVLAGTGGKNGVDKFFHYKALAAKRGYPCIVLGDGGGARLPDVMGAARMMRMSHPTKGPRYRDRQYPLITAIMGECYGAPSWEAAESDIVIQVKGATMAVAGPSVMEVATSQQTTKEELGGWELHARGTGQVDLFAEDDADCLRLIRRALEYFPNNANELPPVVPCGEPADKRLDKIFNVVPSNPRRAYDMHQVIQMISDPDTMLELKPFYDGSLITCLARLDGHVVGFLANNPMVTAGAMGPGACEKGAAFICLCDSFHIPLIFLHDTPGFLVGKEAEERKMPLKIITFLESLHKSTVPRISVIIRKSYGMAHFNMSGANMSSYALLAWPTADVSFSHPDVAVNVVYGRRLKRMGDSDGKTRQELLEELIKSSTPWEAAGAGLIDGIIHPADTRKVIIQTLRRARGAAGQQGRSQRLLAGWPRMF